MLHLIIGKIDRQAASDLLGTLRCRRPTVLTTRPVAALPYRSVRTPSIGSVGDSFDNALAESVNGLYKTAN
jgi:hypothetical protein